MKGTLTDQGFTSAVDDTGNDRFLGWIRWMRRSTSMQCVYVGFDVFQSVVIWLWTIPHLNIKVSASPQVREVTRTS